MKAIALITYIGVLCAIGLVAASAALQTSPMQLIVNLMRII